MNQFELFLQELAKVFQFSHLAPDEHGACQIIFKDGKIPLLFEFDDHLVPNTILLSSPLASIPASHHLDIYEALLIGNSSQEEVLSVKPDEDFVYLHRRFHPDIQSANLDYLLKQFIEKIHIWKSKIETVIQTPPQIRSSTSHPSAIQVFPYKA